MCATYMNRLHHKARRKRMWCFFYICLTVHIMYTIHNKATFMVIDNINPIIRNSKNSTISDHLLTLNKSRGLEVTLTSAYSHFLAKYYTTFFSKKQANKVKFYVFL